MNHNDRHVLVSVRRDLVLNVHLIDRDIVLGPATPCGNLFYFTADEIAPLRSQCERLVFCSNDWCHERAGACQSKDPTKSSHDYFPGVFWTGGGNGAGLTYPRVPSGRIGPGPNPR